MGSLLVWVSGAGVSGVLAVKEISSGVETLISLVVKRPKLILLSGLVIVVILCFGITRQRFDNDPEHVGVRGSKAVAALKVINRKASKKGDPLHIVIKGKDVEALNDALDPLEKLLSGWKKEGLIGRYDSINVLLPAPYKQKIKIDRLKEIVANNTLHIGSLKKTLTRELEKNNLTYEKDYINTYLKGVVAALNRHELVGLKELGAIPNPRINCLLVF